MYRSFYGLSEPPFELSFDPKFVFYTSRHREALSRLENGLLSASPLTVLLGDPGTGKTTLLRASLQSDRCRHIKCVYLKNPTLTREQLVDTLRAELESTARAQSRAATPLKALRAMLRERRSQGLSTALVVDEAESLSGEMFEELCMLATIEEAGTPLLPLVLSGQLALWSRLDRPSLRPLQSRMALRCELAPLGLAQTASYILWRVRAAGGRGGKLFTREAVTLVHELSQGIPRTISVICDNALLSGFARKLKPVTREVVQEVCSQLDLGSTPPPRGSAVPAGTKDILDDGCEVPVV